MRAGCHAQVFPVAETPEMAFPQLVQVGSTQTDISHLVARIENLNDSKVSPQSLGDETEERRVDFHPGQETSPPLRHRGSQDFQLAKCGKILASMQRLGGHGEPAEQANKPLPTFELAIRQWAGGFGTRFGKKDVRIRRHEDTICRAGLGCASDGQQNPWPLVIGIRTDPHGINESDGGTLQPGTAGVEIRFLPHLFAIEPVEVSERLKARRFFIKKPTRLDDIEVDLEIPESLCHRGSEILADHLLDHWVRWIQKMKGMSQKIRANGLTARGGKLEPLRVVSMELEGVVDAQRSDPHSGGRSGIANRLRDRSPTLGKLGIHTPVSPSHFIALIDLNHRVGDRRAVFLQSRRDIDHMRRRNIRVLLIPTTPAGKSSPMHPRTMRGGHPPHGGFGGNLVGGEEEDHLLRSPAFTRINHNIRHLRKNGQVVAVCFLKKLDPNIGLGGSNCGHKNSPLTHLGIDGGEIAETANRWPGGRQVSRRRVFPTSDGARDEPVFAIQMQSGR